MISWNRARFAGIIQLSNETANTISVFVGPPVGPKQLWRFAYLLPKLDNREAIAKLTDHISFKMDSLMIIIGDLNSRLEQLSCDHGDNPRGHILKAHICTMNMEVINTRLSIPQMTFSNRNGSSIVNFVLAEPAAKATILDFWVAEANGITEERNELCLASDHRAIECSISLPHTEGIVARPWLRTNLLDTDDDARDKYHRLLDDGFKEWAEEAKQLLALDPNTTTFEEAMAALESLNDNFCSIIRDVLEQS
ncbi:hypothetical protein LPJ71_003512, partial [Coemansia sp. S17]